MEVVLQHDEVARAASNLRPEAEAADRHARLQNALPAGSVVAERRLSVRERCADALDDNFVLVAVGHLRRQHDAAALHLPELVPVKPESRLVVLGLDLGQTPKLLIAVSLPSQKLAQL